MNCSASAAITLLQGKWRVPILCAMRDGPVRLGQLSRLLPEASKKVLMTELKQLVALGLVERLDLSNGGVVRHVEYHLIDPMRPATFLLLEQLEHWALIWDSSVQKEAGGANSVHVQKSSLRSLSPRASHNEPGQSLPYRHPEWLRVPGS